MASFSTTVSSILSDRVVVTAPKEGDVILHNATSAITTVSSILSDWVVVTAPVEDDVVLHHATSATQAPNG